MTRSDAAAGPRRRRRVGAASLAIVGVAVLAAGAGWSARTIVDSRLSEDGPVPVQTVAVTEGTVSRSIEVNVTARWERRSAGYSHCTGVVTSAANPFYPIDVGEPVMAVDLRPMTAAQGTVPLFRDLAAGVRGDDVGQLQTMLTRLGHRAAVPIDGVFDAATAAAVRRWQRANDLPVSGTVGTCDLVFLDELPARVALDDVVAGRTITGDVPVSALAPEPLFEIRTTGDQATLLRPGHAVDIRHGDGTWAATIAAATTAVDGTLVVTLTGRDGSPVCFPTCAAVPVDGEALFPAAVHVVPATAGLVVPVTALMTSPTGAVQVRTEAGDVWTVEVLATAGGLSVIDGVEAGTRVQLSGNASP